ncbi:DUF4865 family protein [Actinophytocola sp.]|uniref:DUF4865 family protein n=1 Tax=Actinophytocola sp. TaxID=1872138 RepID=UPI002ECFC309
MIASQYEITLPADYDMGIIRDRVANLGHLLDDRKGLALKAYLVREHDPVNQYAPFYLWHDTGAMAQFLVGGGGFQNIVRDFGRPVVRQWTGLAAVAGKARDTTPTTASRQLTPPDDVEAAIKDLNTLRHNKNVHTAALALDPHHWELVRFVLWRDAPEEDGTHYKVHHLSTPELDRLPNGQDW